MGAVEIYICKEGQALKEGKLEYSSSIDGKEDAEADAKRRCGKDNTIKKIAYYSVRESGEFRVFYSYTNPNCGAVLDAAKPAAKKKKPVKKKGFIDKIKAALGM